MADRRRHRLRHGNAGRPVDGPRGPGPDRRADSDELHQRPGTPCPREGKAGRVHGERHAGSAPPGTELTIPPGLSDFPGRRQRERHGRGDPLPDLRAVLHHEGSGRDGAWGWPRDRERVRGTSASSAPRERNDLLRHLPVRRAGKDPKRKRTGRRPRAGVRRGIGPSSWPKMKRWCGSWPSKFSRETGYTVLDAPNGGAALAISDRYEGSIDLLVTDRAMPGTPRIELARRVCDSRPGSSSSCQGTRKTPW